jgi:O-antigen/teichoic acid export membrane protein
MNLNVFIRNFIKRKGLLVAGSSIVEKISGFLLVIIATQYLSKSDFGLLTYANTILVFLLPFFGFGMHQALIRFGSIVNSQIEKKNLFIFTLKKGIKFSVILLILIIILSPILTSNLKNSRIYLLILSFQLISLFMYQMICIYSRLLNLNKLYAQITVLKSFFLVVSAFLLAVNFGSIGYVVALSVVPFLISVFYIKKLNLLSIKDDFQLNLNYKEYLLYGLYTSLGGVLSQLLYAVDILLIGNILKDETSVAFYKVSSIIPFSILILPIIFIKTDFVVLANKSVNDKVFIKNYYLNYLKIFAVLSVFLIFFFYLFSSQLIGVFADVYQDDSLMLVFGIGIVGAILFRVPLGNILSAIGLAKVNTINSLIILILNIIFSYIFITKYGILGAAIVTAALMWLSGIISLFFFINFIRK